MHLRISDLRYFAKVLYLSLRLRSNKNSTKMFLESWKGLMLLRWRCPFNLQKTYQQLHRTDRLIPFLTPPPPSPVSKTKDSAFNKMKSVWRNISKWKGSTAKGYFLEALFLTKWSLNGQCPVEGISQAFLIGNYRGGPLLYTLSTYASQAKPINIHK